MKKTFLLFLSFLSLQALAQSTTTEQTDAPPRKHKKKLEQVLKLQTFEDNLVGYSFDSDDQPFLDFTLSESLRVYPFDKLSNLIQQDLHLYFSFTTRLAQYIGTRPSSPVIEKRFNPQMFLEYSPKKGPIDLKIRFGYGHESNGQSVEDSATFYSLSHSYKINKSQDPIKQTLDYMSRGWDYVGLSGVYDFATRKDKNVEIETELNLRYYLDYGFMEGNKEEYRSWESPWYGNRYTRNEVSGLTAIFTVFRPERFINKLRLSYESGITSPFAHNTVKVLLGFNVMKLPMGITYMNGYNGDIAQYGKRISSLGITFVISSFDKPFLKPKMNKPAKG